MEFERAIYRVYERSLEGLLMEEEMNESAIRKPCQLLQWCAVSMTVCLLFSLVVIHSAFVGSVGCLQRELQVYNESTATYSTRHFDKDEVLYIRISNRLLQSSGSTLRMTVDDDDVSPNDKYSSSSSSLNSSVWQPWTSPVVVALNGSESVTGNSTAVSAANTTTIGNDTAFHRFDFDYQVTFDVGVTMLDQRTRANHHFRYTNVTLGESDCFGTPLSRSLLFLGGLDIAILNNVMYTFTTQGGYLVTRVGQVYNWKPKQVLSSYAIPIDEWIVRKLAMLWNSLWAFFLVSTTTALLVRVLISSGVVLVFPILLMMQWIGLHQISWRMISMSYPWIGLPMQLIRLRNQSAIPFLLGHFTKMVLYYLMYVGAQNLYLSMLYDSPEFGLDQIWLYAAMMLWEYYSMLFVRARHSIQLFPRATLALFLVYHFYYYSFPSGFHSLALMTTLFIEIALMVYCVRTFELKAFRQGLITPEQPRMLYVSLPWPTWRADLAPEYSLFMPPTNRVQSVYQAPVPPVVSGPADTGNNNPNLQGSGSTANPLNERNDAGDIELNAVPSPSSQGSASTTSTASQGFLSRLFSGNSYQSMSQRGYTAVDANSAHG